MKYLVLLFSLFYLSTLASIEEYATYIDEAKVLVETRQYLKDVRDDLKTGGKLNRKMLSDYERELEHIAVRGCDCESEENIIRAQAYALIGAINGIISKETKSISHGKKSYNTLAKARSLDSRNFDAIRGQGEAIKAILSQGFLARNIVSLSLGVNLQTEKRKLIRDLRTFKENQTLLNLADQLSKV
jgi:hypothetical protein